MDFLLSQGWSGKNPLNSAEEEPSGPVAVTQEQDDTIEENSSFLRKFATKDNLFPEKQKGSLDSDKLKKYSLTRERMMLKDALFFYQLLLPLHKTD